MNMKNKFLLLTIALFVCAASAWAEPRLVAQETHNGSLENLKYSQDGNFLLSFDAGSAKVWDVKSGMLVRSFNISAPTVGSKRNCCDISPDGRYLIYVSPDGFFKKADVLTGNEIDVFWGDIDKSSFCVAYSQNGFFYAIAPSEDECDVNIYSAKTDKLLYRLNTYISERATIAFACEKNSKEDGVGTRLIKVGSKVGVYNIHDGKAAFINSNLLSSDWRGFRVEASPDGRTYLVSGDKEMVCVGSFLTGVSKTFSVGGEYPCVKFCGPNMIMVKAGKSDLNVWTFDLENSKKPVLLKKVKIQDEGLCNYCDSFDFSPDGKTYVMAGFFQAVLFSSENNQKIASFDSKSDLRKCLYYPKSEGIYCMANKNVSIFNNKLQKITSVPIKEDNVAIFEDGFYYQKYEGKKIAIYARSFLNAQEDEKVCVVNSGWIDFYERASSQYFAYVDRKSNVANVYDVTKKKIVKSFKPSLDKLKQPGQLVASLDGNYYANAPSFVDACVYDCKKNKLVTLKGDEPVFSPHGKYLALHDFRNAVIHIYETDNFKIINSVDGWNPMCFSDDEKYFALCRGDKCVLYDVEAGKDIKSFDVDLGNQHFLSKDNERFYTGCGPARDLKVYSVKTGQLIARLMMDEDGEWLSYIPEGYFCGTEIGASEFVHMVDGMKVSELGQYAEVLYRPDLVAAKMESRDLFKKKNGVKLADLSASGEPPLVEIEYAPAKSDNRDVTVKFSVEERSGGLGKVYVALNGKPVLLQDRSRKLALSGALITSSASDGKKIYSHTLTLSNGYNLIEAYATNSSGFIESLHAKASVKWEGAQSKPSLHALVIGVNEYRDSNLRLKYAVPDAAAIANAFMTKKGSLYQSVNVVSLLDQKANKADIEKAFKDLAAKVQPDDVFVFYLSGHGTQEDGDYYYIPVDFQNVGSDAVRKYAVSKQFLLDNFYSIKAGKSLIMLDTCNSGSFIAEGYSSSDGGAARLSKDAGQAIISAATSEQYAMEGYEGHGIFTYVVLDALNGKADRDKDGFVTLRELCDYIEDTVPELSYSKWAYRQIPWIDRRKQNFPLVGK